MTDIRKGGCLCGSARYEINLKGEETGNCHCRDCQKQSGAAFVTVTTVSIDNFKWIKEPDGLISISDRASRRFCSLCGTPIQWCGVDYTDVANINTSTLDDPNGLNIVYEIFTRSRMDGVLPVVGAKQSQAGYDGLK